MTKELPLVREDTSGGRHTLLLDHVTAIRYQSMCLKVYRHWRVRGKGCGGDHCCLPVNNQDYITAKQLAL